MTRPMKPKEFGIVDEILIKPPSPEDEDDDE